MTIHSAAICSSPSEGAFATPAAQKAFFIRPYRPADRQAVRYVCVATCWISEYRRSYIPDDWVWAEFWTRYYTDKEPQHTWVIERTSDAKVVGYLSGSIDARRADHYALRIMPGIAWHVARHHLLLRGLSRRPLLSMLGSLVRGELSLPRDIVEEYPGTWHFNLLSELRGSGWGWLLLRQFMEAARQEGVKGIHAQTMSENHVVNRLLEALGFRCADRHKITAFASAHNAPLEVFTWVMKLDPAVPVRASSMLRRNGYAFPPPQAAAMGPTND